MPTGAEYKEWIQAYASRQQLRRLVLEGECRSTAENWPAGKAFEYAILRLYEMELAPLAGGEQRIWWPFEVKLGSGVIEQVDGVVYEPRLPAHCLVEAKDHSEPLNFEPVAKLRAQLERRPPGTLGLVFSRSGFTPAALVLTQRLSPLNVLLWTQNDVWEIFTNGGAAHRLWVKYSRAVTHASVDFDPAEELG